MEKFNRIYGHYPKYPVADAGYGSYNNYLYCEHHDMEKFMKFTMFKKETSDKKYHNYPYRAINFQRDEYGNIICPNGKKFIFKYRKNVYKNKYGRTEASKRKGLLELSSGTSLIKDSFVGEKKA